MPADKSLCEYANHIAVHQGAMGDFLLIWPALLSLSRFLPQQAKYWGGRPCHGHWAKAAGWQPAPVDLRRGVESLYAASTWPAALQDVFVTWFGLGRKPVDISDPRLWFAPCVHEGRFLSPRDLAREALETRDIPWAEDWPQRWREAFGGWQPQGHEHDLLLFPGAGHRAKHWGLQRFLELDRACRHKGWRTAFVLGPAEVERGMDPVAARGSSAAEGPEVLRPESLQQLSDLLLASRRVAGNDCGPMHLAAMHGVPGVALFGPTSRRQWAPEGLVCLAAQTTCRPCSVTTAAIACQDVRCLQELSVDEAMEALAGLE